MKIKSQRLTRPLGHGSAALLRPAARQSPRVAELVIYGDIGETVLDSSVTADTFSESLQALGDVDVIAVRINSGGGDVFDGLAIYNQLKRHPARIEVTVDGLAASIASVIAMAGDTIEMARGARMMIHDAWTLAWGTAAQLRRVADLLGSVSHDLAEIYAQRTSLHVDEVRELMAAESWFSASMAVDSGFADRVAIDRPAAPVAQSKILRAFGKVPHDLLDENERLATAATRALLRAAAFDAERL